MLTILFGIWRQMTPVSLLLVFFLVIKQFTPLQIETTVNLMAAWILAEAFIIITWSILIGFKSHRYRRTAYIGANIFVLSWLFRLVLLIPTAIAYLGFLILGINLPFLDTWLAVCTGVIMAVQVLLITNYFRRPKVRLVILRVDYFGDDEEKTT